MFMNLKGIKLCIKLKNWTIIVFISTLKSHLNQNMVGVPKMTFSFYIQWTP
jgi:hypothetical protein